MSLEDKTHRHLCEQCGRWIVEGPMECPEFNYKDHEFGACEECRHE